MIIKKAFSLLEAAMKENPQYAAAYATKGQFFMDLKQWDNAVKEYGKAIKISPRFAEYYVARAIAYGQMKKEGLAKDDLKHAIAIYNKILENDQSSDRQIYALVNRAFAAYLYGEKKVALKEFKKLLADDPDNWLYKHLTQKIESTPLSERWNILGQP